MTPRARYLVGVLTLLRDGLGPVVEKLLADEITQEEPSELACRFEKIAGVLRSDVEEILSDLGQFAPAVKIG